MHCWKLDEEVGVVAALMWTSVGLGLGGWREAEGAGVEGLERVVGCLPC